MKDWTNNLKKTTTILIVEDSPAQAEQLKYILEQHGYNTEMATSGKQALAILSERKPELIITDIVMPEMDGYELCEHIKSDDNKRDIPVILLTSLTNTEDVLHGLACGANGFITKPYSEDYLLSRIANFLEEKNLSKNLHPKIAIEVMLDGQKRLIETESHQILNLLISSYEAAIHKNTELIKVQDNLKQSDEQLAATKISATESSEFAESITNTVREPLIVLDQDLRVVAVSRSFYNFFKVKPEETVGELIYDLGNKQWDIPKLRELLETILPQKTSFDNYEVEHNFATIGRHVMLLNARQIQRASGKERIILLAIEDITVRKDVEDGLERTRKELEVIKKSADEALEYAQSIVNTVREPLISLDQDLRVVSVSRSFYDVFKVNPKETVGQLIYDLGNKQWDIPKLRELLETILPQKTSFDNYVVEHDFTTIGRRIMLLNARQIQRGSEKERIILLAIEDITERKEIENGLKKAHEELKNLATELERVARVKSEFLANMSHELRTPLNSINGFSEVLYDETFGPLNEKQKKYANNVLTSGKHLLLLINQILDMAKVEAGKMTLTLSNLPMKGLLNEISLLVADMVSKKKLLMELEIAEYLPDIEADDLKVKEILYNLLSNAVKFTPEGGKIGMRAKNAGSEIEIVVWDTGVGVAPENMEKIFEGFFRVDTPYSRITEGTGLGLPLSKNLVELHGGKFSVESKGLNKGLLVRFTLPITSQKVV